MNIVVINIMSDNKVSKECDEILKSLQRNTECIEKIITEKNKEIRDLKEALALSESGKQNAENLVAQIKDEVSEEIKKAYNSGYNAGLINANPTGGTTISQEQPKTLTLTSQS